MSGKSLRVQPLTGSFPARCGIEKASEIEHDQRARIGLPAERKKPRGRRGQGTAGFLYADFPALWSKLLQSLFRIAYMDVELVRNLFNRYLDSSKFLKGPRMKYVFPAAFGSRFNLDGIMIVLFKFSHEFHRSLVHNIANIIG